MAEIAKRNAKLCTYNTMKNRQGWQVQVEAVAVAPIPASLA